MATTTNKQKIVTQLFTPGQGARPRTSRRSAPVLEQFIYAICREDATRDAADRAFSNLQERFYDWNEVRVSSDAGD